MGQRRRRYDTESAVCVCSGYDCNRRVVVPCPIDIAVSFSAKGICCVLESNRDKDVECRRPVKAGFNAEPMLHTA